MRLWLIIILMGSPSCFAGTFTPASCNQGDVNACINATGGTCVGGAHTAVDGDIIQIPLGSCTWSVAGITIPTGIGITIIGNGTPNTTPSTLTAAASCSNTTITENFSGAAMFSATPTFGNSLTRISCMKLIPPGAPNVSPVIINATCTSSGCPNLRLDNLTVPGAWSSGSISDASFALVAGVFGVADHNTVGDGVQTGNGVDFINPVYPGWKGVGQYGDNSWHDTNSWGTNQQFYLENNTFLQAFGTDSDTGTGTGGGGRFTCRFNTFNKVTTADACTNHGTETTGRPRGGRQAEFYGNTMGCDVSNSPGGCGAGIGVRSGPLLSFGNTFNVNGVNWSYWAAFDTQRAWRVTPWWMCNGMNPLDINDGQTIDYTGTISSVTSTTITINSAPWTLNRYNYSSSSPGATYWMVYDQNQAEFAGISSNTTSVLTLSFKFSNLQTTFGGGTFTAGDTIEIIGVTLAAAGTHTGSNGVSVMTDSTKSGGSAWTTNQWIPAGARYSVTNLSNGNASQIVSNGTNTITGNGNSTLSWNTNDPYAVTRATQCLDQGGSGGGGITAFNAAFVPAPVPPTVYFSKEASYEWMDSGTAPQQAVIASTQNLNVIANRDYYGESANQAAQSNATTPFSGTSGTGHGTLAFRPTTCTTGVGYWASDQGSWNTSSNGFGQGQLYICTSTNTWTLSYTPYTYPHPLTSTQAGGTSPAPCPKCLLGGMK